MPRKKYPANIVGPQIQKVRYQMGLTQEQLAARCQMAGLDISRATLGHIEARLRFVSDEELLAFALVFKVRVDDLYPVNAKRRRIRADHR